MIQFPEDIIGKRFNRLIVLDFYQGKWQKELWCRCDCGKEKHFTHHQLTSGKVKSCGCYSKEICSKRSKTHGKSKGSIEYKSWSHMKYRCDNEDGQDYYLYGGRGIKYCKRWAKFENFLADMGQRPSKRHTLDRFPNKNGDYKPSNCRWATPKEQANNTRANVLITIGGLEKNLTQWSSISGMPIKVISARLGKGWPGRDAVFAPTQKTKRKGLVSYTNGAGKS